MTIEEVIKAALAAAPELAGVPIRPNVADQGDKGPYIVYQLYAGTRPQVLRGDCGLGNPRYQFDVYTKTALQTSAMKDVVRKALIAAPLLNAVFVTEGGVPPFNETTKLHRHRQDFSFWYQDQ